MSEYGEGRKFMESNPIIQATIKRLNKQQIKGYRKYGTYVKVDDYTLSGWIEHALQEQTDNLIYLQCQHEKVQQIKQELDELMKFIPDPLVRVRLKQIGDKL